MMRIEAHVHPIATFKQIVAGVVVINFMIEQKICTSNGATALWLKSNIYSTLIWTAWHFTYEVHFKPTRNY